MGAWSVYEQRMAARGITRRDVWLDRTKETITRRIRNSLSFKQVKIDGIPYEVAITKTPDKSEKNIFSLPDQHLIHGGIVEYADSVWLITELDAEDEVYDRGFMRRCNHILRWTSKDGTLKEKWCVVEDGTKYLIGEKASQVITIGDARIALTVRKDEDTIELKRGMRFLINDTDSNEPVAYQITKANKLFNLYDGKGVFRFILNEVESIPEDDYDARVAGITDWTLNRGLDSEDDEGAMTVSEIKAALGSEDLATLEHDKEVWL